MKLYQRFSGFTITIIACLISVLLWSQTVPYWKIFNNSSIFFQYIGQTTALVGTVLLSLNFILAIRHKFIDLLMGGMNRVYILHHLLGAISFVLLLIHPIMIVGMYVQISIYAAAALFIPSMDNLPIFIGLIALFVMIFSLVATFFIKLAYPTWKLTHQYLGLAMLLASLHVYLIDSTISNNLTLRFFMLGLCLAALSSFCYRVLFGKFLVHRFNYQVTSVTQLSKDVWEISAMPTGKALHYQPGQFVFVDFHSLGITSEIHPFSISSAPHESEIKLTIKSLGDYTETLQILRVGSSMRIEGAYGRFTYSNYDNPRQIWIAGGIGMTPFLSMAKSLVHNQKPMLIDLYYVTKTPEEAVCVPELQAISQQFPYFRLITHFSATQGRFNPDIIRNQTSEMEKYDYFICGPKPMMASMKVQLAKLGIKKTHIHTEEFSF